MKQNTISIAVWTVCCLHAISAFAALTVADLPASGGVLHDKTIYMVSKNKTLTGNNSSALVVASNAEVVIYIPSGVSLDCRGSDASSYLNPGQPGIYLPKGSSLYVTGAGNLTARGGCAGNGGNGGSGGGAFTSGSGSTGVIYGGIGGIGGNGGAGAGAGIGTSGGKGGEHGWSGAQVEGGYGTFSSFKYGNDGGDGQRGGNSADVGDVYIVGTITVNSYGGTTGTAGVGGGKKDKGASASYVASSGNRRYVAGGDGGGGGGGGGGSTGSSIGAGGVGAGGGGAGGGGGLWGTGTVYNGQPQLVYGHGYGGNGGIGSKSGGEGEMSEYPQVGVGGGQGGRGGSNGSKGNSGNIYISNTATLVAANTSPQRVDNNQPLLKCLIVFVNNTNPEKFASTNVMYFGASNVDNINVPKPAEITGEEFKGFYTDESTSGQQVFDENGTANMNALKELGFVDADGFWIHAQDATYYAHWAVKSYTIRFDANGGTGTTTASRSHGDALGTLPTPTREGYTFLGWFTTAGGGTQVTASTVVTSDATYYAHWTVKSYTVRFDANGGTGTTTASRSHGDALGTLPTPTREGYTFLGWFTMAGGGTQVTASTVVTSDATYYAHWTVKSYIVWFDANGGTGTTTASRSHGDALGTLPTPTREGYTFLGWFTMAGGGTQVTASTVVTSDVTYYAGWEKEKQVFDIDVPTGVSTNITEVIGAEYGDLIKRGGGDLTLSVANEFTGSITNCGGLIIADLGVGIPSTACLVFKSGVYAPRTARTLTVPLGTGPGEFDMTLDHLKIAALNAPLTINFGGNAEPIVSGGSMNPNAKAFHFGWKDNNNEYLITILNPLVLSSPLTLRSQRNAPVTLAGGVRAASGVTGKSLDMPDEWPSQFRFTETGTLYIPENNWNPQGGGTTIFDGGSHEVGDVYGSRHNIVFTNGAHFVSKVCYFGRDNADYTFNVYAYSSVISNASGFVRLGCTSNATGNWYMKGGELAFAAVSGTKPPSFAIGDMGHGAFYQESGDVKLRNTSLWLGYNSAYSGFYRIDGGTFNTAKAMNVGYYGTGTVEVVSGTLYVGNVFSLGHEVSGVGRMRMSSGTVDCNFNSMIGRYGNGYLLMTGGYLNQASDMEFSLGRFPGSVGRTDIIGGELKYWEPTSNNSKHIGWEGTGVVSVASSGLFSFSNTVHLGTAVTGYGEIDLYEGGVFESTTLNMGSGYQKIVTDGGTFRVGGNGATVNFFNNAANLDESYVGLRGVTFDTRDNTATIGNFALDGRSPGAIRKVGSGTLVLTGIPQTGGGIEVNEGTVALASGTIVGTAFTVPTTEDVGDNVYPSSPSQLLVAQNYLLHRWSFNQGSMVDSVAGNVATIHDDNAAEANIAVKDGVVSLLRGRTNGVRYLDLGSGLFGEEDGEFTVEFWARVPDWSASSKLLTIGNSATEEIFLNMPGGVCARGASNEPLLYAWGISTVPSGTMCHFSIVIGKATDGKRDVRFRLKDATTGVTYADTICPSRTYSPILHQNVFAFGYSYHNEVDAKMDIDEVRIWKAALSDAQLSANAVRGPDNLPILNMERGSGPVKIASGAAFDLGGNTISYPGVAGAGTVRNGAITIGTLNVTGAMRLDADVTVTGEIVFAEGSSLVTAGTLNIAGATVRYVAPISVPSLTLASTEGGGRITGVPAAVDLGMNSRYNLSIDASVLKLELQVDPLPEITSDSDVAGALAGATDETRLRGYITSKAQYDLFRVWVDAKGLEHQAVKTSPRAWFSYAIGANGLVERAFQNGDVAIDSLLMVTNGTFSFEVNVSNVVLGAEATAESLATVFEVQGSSSLNASSFSSDKVTATLGISANGRLLVIATPKVAHGKFFVRVRMHADDDGWMVDTHRKVQLWEDGPYWSETNIGAEKPWEYGLYFWWGDVVGHKYEGGAWVSSDGTQSNFSFDSSNTPTYGKSIETLQNEGWITADGILAPEHDAAHVHWGNGWRMPTKQDLEDLVSKCDWTWTTMNGVPGYIIRGKVEYASDSIFLPVAGFCIGSSFDSAGLVGDYWSSAPHPDGNAWGIFFNASYHYTRYNYGRYYGYSIRPVQDAAK